MDDLLKSFAENKGWNVNKQIVNGEELGYLITIIQRRRLKSFFVPLTHISDEDKVRVKNFLSEQKVELKIQEYGFNNNVLYIQVKEKPNAMTEYELNSLLSLLTNFLTSNNIGTQKYCMFCGLEAPDDQCTMNNIQFYTHSSCYKYHLRSKKKGIKDFSNRNYLLGTLGALIGGLIGSIPWAIVGYIGFFSSFLGYLIGIGSLKGYKIMGGKFGFKTRWIILACVLFSVIFSEFISVLILSVVAGDGFSLTNIFYYLLSDLFNLGLGFLFAFLGIYHLFKDLGGDI